MIDSGSNKSLFGLASLSLIKKLNLPIIQDSSYFVTTADGLRQKVVPITFGKDTKTLKILLIPLIVMI